MNDKVVNSNVMDGPKRLDNETIASNKHRITRSGRVSKLYNFKTNFLEIAMHRLMVEIEDT